LFEMRPYQPELPLRADQPGDGGLVDRRQRRIGKDGEIHHQALPDAVLREIGDAMRQRLARRSRRDRLTREADAAGTRPVDAEEDAGDLGAATADQPAKAEDLAGADSERDVVEDTGA